MREPRFRQAATTRMLVLALLLGWQGGLRADVPISVQTTECGGESGLATFDVDRLYKIQPGTCADPGNPGQRLQQVLIRSDSDLTRYDVVQVTQDEATAILEQVRAVSRARLENLTQSQIRAEIQVQHRETPDSERATGAGATSAAAAASTATMATTAPPRIELIDPPVRQNRSANRIIVAPDTRERVLVGRVDAAAGMLSLTVNGADLEPDPAGLFKARVVTRESTTPISIVAVDRQGNDTRLEFELVRQRPDDASTGDASTGGFGRYHALIIANNAYQHLDDLATPANDGLALARILDERFGFHTVTLFDASRYEILSQLNALRSELTEDDNLLIYFAGHGAYDPVNNRGHWLPIDAEHDSTANWVSTVDVTDVVNAMSAKHVLVVADSCYSGALSRDVSTDLDPGMSDALRQRWLQTMARNRSRHVLTSGGLRPVPDDAGNGHSIFANAFLDSLRGSAGIVEVSMLFREVRQRVEERAQSLQVEQTPTYAELKQSGHEYGEFLLVTR